MGNICRSSAAEEIMRTLAGRARRGDDITVDSAGISSYHRGEPADGRMRMHALRRGYRITHLSRPVRISDFHEFDLIVGMDDYNIEALREMSPDVESEKKIVRMTDYCAEKVADHVPDPYYGGSQGFETVLDILEDACNGLLRSIGSGETV